MVILKKKKLLCNSWSNKSFLRMTYKSINKHTIRRDPTVRRIVLMGLVCSMISWKCFHLFVPSPATYVYSTNWYILLTLLILNMMMTTTLWDMSSLWCSCFCACTYNRVYIQHNCVAYCPLPCWSHNLHT